MRLASKGGNRFIDHQILRLFRLRKLIYRNNRGQTTIL
jgi:hypothetical protein